MVAIQPLVGTHDALLTTPAALDPCLNSPARLRIMVRLQAADSEALVEFTHLRQVLMLSNGCLGTHLTSLQAAGYIAVTKDFHRNRPRTRVGATSSGRQALQRHIEALELLLSEARFDARLVA